MIPVLFVRTVNNVTEFWAPSTPSEKDAAQQALTFPYCLVVQTETVGVPGTEPWVNVWNVFTMIDEKGAPFVVLCVQGGRPSRNAFRVILGHLARTKGET